MNNIPLLWNRHGEDFEDGRSTTREIAMHFGLYLKNKGIISAEQLVSALEAQTNTLVPLGQLALEENILSARDIFDILRAQCESPHVRFGELAIELGLMSRDDLMRLLMIQADRKRSISDILVWQSILTERQVKSEMAAFRRDQQSPRRGATRTKVVPVRRLHANMARNADPMISV